MHEKVSVLAQDVARLRDDLKLYRSHLIHALELIQQGLPHSFMWGAISIRQAAERLVSDISVFTGHHIKGEKLTLTNLIGQLRNKVHKLTPQLDQPEEPYHTWIPRLEEIDRIVGGAPHLWVQPAQLDSLVQSVEDLLKLLQELYCEYGTSPRFPTIYFDVAPILMAYKKKSLTLRTPEFIPLDTDLIPNADITDSDDEPEDIEEDEEYQDKPRLQPVEKARSKESLSPVPILKALREHPQVTILGDAGSGKTQAAIAFCREFNTVGEYNVAIHIRLKLFGDGGMDALIRRSLGDTLPAERPLEKFGREWNLALVCDGLDECSESRRKECIRSICELTRLNVRVVVLSRERGLQLDQLTAWTTYKLKALDDDQRDAFLRSRLPKWAEKEHKALVRQINSQPGGAYLFRNPFFLNVLTKLLQPPKPSAATHPLADGSLVYPDHHGDRGLFHYDYKSPQALSRVRIMRVFVERTLKRELKKLGMESDDQYLQPLVGAFSRAGFNSLFSEEDSFTAEDFYSWYLREPCHTRRLVRSDIERLLVRTLDFLPDAGLYSFPHQNIETFLAARHVYKHPGDGNQITQDAARDCTHVLSFLLEMGARQASPLPKGQSQLRTILDASLYRIAWELDPLLAVIGHKQDDNFVQTVAYGPLIDVRPGLLEDPWTRGLVRCCLDRHATCEVEANEITEERGCSVPYLLAQRLRDPWLWYTGTFCNNSKNRIKRLKHLMTTEVEPWGALIEYAAEGHPSWKEELSRLPLFDRFAYGLAYLDEDTFLESATGYAVDTNPRLWALFVLRGGERGYYTKPLWKMLVPVVHQLSFRQLHRLIIKKDLFPRFGNTLDQTEKDLFDSLLSRERLLPVLYNIFPPWMIVRKLGTKEIKSRLLANLTPICAHEAVRWRILTPEDIPSDKIRAWCQRADPNEAGKLASQGIATKQHFPLAKLEAWTHSVGVNEAIRLAEGGLLTGVDFDKQLRDTWRASAKPKARYRLFTTRVLPKNDFGSEELHEWLASFGTRRLYTLVEKGLVGRDDFGQTYIDALRQRTATADCQDGDKPGLYGPPLLVRLGVVEARDRDAIPEQALERAAKGGRTVKKLWFDLGIVTLDELWRCESSNSLEVGCLSLVVTDTLRQLLVRVYHPACGFHFMDLQKIQHLCSEIKGGSVILGRLISTRCAGGTTFLPPNRSLSLCMKTADLSKLPVPKEQEESANGALARLSALIVGGISAGETQAAETALEPTGCQFRIPYSDRLDEGALKSVQEQLVGKWFTLRVDYLKDTGERGAVCHPLFFNNPKFVLSNILGATTVSIADYIFGPVFVECYGRRHVFAVQRGAVWVGRCAPGPGE